MNEKAVRFYGLLEQSFRLDASEWHHLAVISLLPGQKPHKIREVLDTYSKASQDFLSEMSHNNNDDYSGIDQLKGNL